MLPRLLACVLALTVCSAATDGAKLQIAPVTVEKTKLELLPVHVAGRVRQQGTNRAATYQRQWPGTYFETAFVGDEAFFKLGAGDAILKITVDAEPPKELARPAPGLYRLGGLSRQLHHVRLEVITESQAGPTAFDGFFVSAGIKPAPEQARPHQIEFIGDSHTVGYGNTSPKRECTEEEVWATTDTSRGIAPRVARHFNADYQVNAISGRGIVRNYNGFAADPLPVAYPFTLFDHTERYDDPKWRPEVIVISLGTNDFSTPLHDGEKWKTRDDLHTDYEKTYTEFLHQLRAKNPTAYFVLWATDMADGEILSEVQHVAEGVRAVGDQRITVVPVKGLEVTGCNYHPSLRDDERIADAVSAAIESARAFRKD